MLKSVGILASAVMSEQEFGQKWCLDVQCLTTCLCTVLFFKNPQLSPDWQVDYESYTWRKLDPGSEETQTLVREYFSWEGTFQHVGKAVNQGKIFK